VLSKTISTSGDSTVMQTDIAILEDTKSGLFLKARNRSDILKDLILVALIIDTEYKFDVKKNITDIANKAGVKTSTNKDLKVNIDLFQGVYNLFRTNKLLHKFQKIAKDLQLNFTIDNNIQKYIKNNIENENLTRLLDDIIYSRLKINDFYGYRHEISLDQENILEKTIIPSKVFNEYKEQLEDFHEIISFRLLFDQAILVLKCDEKAKQSLPEKFKKGVVFRDLQGHKKAEEHLTETNPEVSYKILLIPAATCGELVDDKFVEELRNIIISDPKENIVVITKIDKASSYEEYTQHNYKAFIDSLKEQIVTTHNKLVCKLQKIQKSDEGKICEIANNTMVKKIFTSFDNAYLSKITKDKQGNFDAELHKIVCKNKSNQELSENDIEDIVIVENWHSLLASALKSENNVSHDMGSINFNNIKDKKKKTRLIVMLSGNIKSMIITYINYFKCRVIYLKHLYYIEQLFVIFIMNHICGTAEILNMY